jgi:cytoskeletal protein CcmA (bactofilin family)
MFKRDEAARPPQPTVASPSSTPQPAAGRTDASRQQERDMVNIGKSVVIKGELSGSEDLTIEGQVDGKIELKQNVLTIGPNGKIKAEIFAKAIVVQGEVHGNITATERVDIRDNGSVDGDVSAPRVAIADGAHFRGAIDMQRQGAKVGAETKPAAAAPVAAAPASVAR